ncbi:MAG: glutathione peroxidase [Acholeplasmataceae bacterium]
MNKLYDFSVLDSQNNQVNLSDYKDKVLIIVNTASKCGFTPQYEDLESLYETYKDQGLEILAFPCNQFANQDPGTNEEIQSFCQVNFGITFPVLAKIDVNGENEDPLYTYLKDEQKGLLGKDIKWNFTKFLIDRKGNIVKRFGPQINPNKMIKDIEKLL